MRGTWILEVFHYTVSEPHFEKGLIKYANVVIQLQYTNFAKQLQGSIAKGSHGIEAHSPKLELEGHQTDGHY